MDQPLENSASSGAESTSDHDIAIVGMACRVPGARNYREFWANLCAGREALTELSDQELRDAGVSEAAIKDPSYVKAGMFLDDMRLFDPGFFGLGAQDGKIMDPQHRHFLETCWEAFEDAGVNPFESDQAIGIFAGSGHNAYLHYNLLNHADLLDDVGFFLLRHTGNDKDFLATRVSYCFDLKGPSVNIQTACSTSLVAVHTAVQSLLNGECDLAMAGGVTINLPDREGYFYKDGEILAVDGHCRPFDADSNGTVFGSGAGVVLLKRMDEALANGDNIHAIIKSSAVNNDGADKVSYLAPSVDGQAEAMTEALELAEIDPASIGFIECHGTGTELGDPIEVAALTQAYGGGGPTLPDCAIGSVKSNIGHLDTAAGVAGLIKATLSLKHRKLVPTVNYSSPNPAVDFDSNRFYVNERTSDWSCNSPRRAAVNSLGVGGTNAHIILEEAPAAPIPDTTTGRTEQLLLLSARSDQALQRQAVRLAEFLGEDNSTGRLNDVAFTLASGRKKFRQRGFVVAGELSDAVDKLDTFGTADIVSVDANVRPRKVAFMFAGGGAQYAGMGQDLYQREPIYRDAVDQCLTILDSLVDYDLRSLLYPAVEMMEQANRDLQQPSRTLPALFITQYAQAKLWMSMGVQPAALIGHSLGENTAACLAGVLSLSDALGLVVLRGKLFEQVPAGGMLSVERHTNELDAYLSEDIVVAAVNAPGLTVLSGSKSALSALEAQLEKDDISFKRVAIDIAAHSPMLEPILGEFRAYLQSIPLGKPQLRFISNRSGDWITDAEATDAEYWVQHLRHTVRFSQGVQRLLSTEDYHLLEVGPGRTLASLASMQLGASPEQQSGSRQLITSSMRHPEEESDDMTVMLVAMGRLWQHETEIDWRAFYAEQACNKLALPTYAFDHSLCWIEPGKDNAAQKTDHAHSHDCIYQSVWAAEPRRVCPTSVADWCVLLLCGDSDYSRQLSVRLKSLGAEVIELQASRRLTKQPGNYALRIDQGDDYVHLLDAISQSGKKISHVIHALALDLEREVAVAGAGEHSNDEARTFDLARDRTYAFDSLFYLAQAIANEDWAGSVNWLALTAGAQCVAGDVMGSALQGMLNGAMPVIAHEFNVHATIVDLPARASQFTSSKWLDDSADQLIALMQPVEQLVSAHSASSVRSRCELLALRGNQLFAQMQQHTSFGGQVAERLREGGSYLITGGLGGLGLAAAEAMTAQANIKLILLSRRKLPQRQYWDRLIEQEASEAVTLQRIKQIEASNCELLIRDCDVSDLNALQALADELGPLNGIVHTAGIIDDSLLALKEIKAAHQVLQPKVNGSLALAQAFELDKLDFLMLYSSTSAFIGLPGQFDYAAANAFLDSFAAQLQQQGVNAISINWPAWQDIGMAATLAAGDVLPTQAPGKPIDHPLLDRLISEPDDSKNDSAVFSTLFSVDKYWLLSEHRIKDGACLIPGSGFLELARAAWTELNPERPFIELNDVHFDLPFFVADSEHKILQVELQPNTQIQSQHSARFVISSELDGEQIEHAGGVISGVVEPTDSPEMLDLDAIALSCTHGRQTFDDPDHHPLLDFGDRWRVLQLVEYGEREALITLELPTDLLSDLDQFRLHPALLDMATAGAQHLIEGYQPHAELYVPVSYHSLKLTGQFTANMFSHVVLREAGVNSTSQTTAVFDIVIADTEGCIAATVEGFTLQKIADVRSLKNAVLQPARQDNSELQRTLELGIQPELGVQALIEIIGYAGRANYLVSANDPAYLQAELLKPYLSHTADREQLAQHDPDSDPEITQLEQQLQQHPAVEAAIVRSFLDEGEQRRLIAYFIADWDHHITVSELRQYAKQHLPEGSLPQQFIECDEFPATDGGEVDRNQLLDPFAPKDTYIAPKTTTQRGLVKIWQEVLGVERIGLADNFFDAGGHSLLAIRAIVKTDKRFAVRLDQATMVMHTLEQIAREIDEQLPQREDDSAEEAAANDATTSVVKSAQNAPAAQNESSDQSGSAGGLKGLRSLFGKK